MAAVECWGKPATKVRGLGPYKVVFPVTRYRRGGPGHVQRDCNEESGPGSLRSEVLGKVWEIGRAFWAASLGVFQAANIFYSRTDGDVGAK